MNNGRKAVAGRLRNKIDGNDPFITGCQIIAIRRFNRQDPEWTKSDKEVQKVLLLAFPKLASSPKQRTQAGRWMRVIQLYFRKHFTHGEIAEELGMTYPAVISLIRSIKRVAAGQRADGSKVRKGLQHAITQTDSGGSV